MAKHTFISIRIHFVFGTKSHVSIPDGLQPALWTRMRGLFRTLAPCRNTVNGARDHVHVFASIPATITAAEFVQKVKANSSRWMHEEGSFAAFEWQEGYGAFSVSMSQTGATI